MKSLNILALRQASRGVVKIDAGGSFVAKITHEHIEKLHAKAAACRS